MITDAGRGPHPFVIEHRVQRRLGEGQRCQCRRAGGQVQIEDFSELGGYLVLNGGCAIHGHRDRERAAHARTGDSIAPFGISQGKTDRTRFDVEHSYRRIGYCLASRAINQARSNRRGVPRQRRPDHGSHCHADGGPREHNSLLMNHVRSR